MSLSESAQVHVPREFVNDFALVAEYYGVKKAEPDEPPGEYEEMVDAVRRHTADAVECFTSIAAEIRAERGLTVG